MDTMERIAAGGPATYERTYEHPKYGPITFRRDDLPTAADWLKHANRQDLLIAENGGDPNVTSNGTGMMAAAYAGAYMIFDRIKIGEKRIADPDGVPGHEKVENEFYDPMDDDGWAFMVNVWIDFMTWRTELLQSKVKAAELGNSSGETGGGVSDDSSLAPMGSPSTIPA